MAGKSWFRWYYASPFFACAVIGRLAIIAMHHYDPRPAWSRTSTAEGSEDQRRELARVLDASPGDLARDLDARTARSNLSARLVQLAHDAREGGARDVALAAYDADDAVIHGDCAALLGKLRALQTRAASTPHASTVGTIIARASTLCDDTGGSRSD